MATVAYDSLIEVYVGDEDFGGQRGGYERFILRPEEGIHRIKRGVKHSSDFIVVEKDNFFDVGMWHNIEEEIAFYEDREEIRNIKNWGEVSYIKSVEDEGQELAEHFTFSDFIEKLEKEDITTKMGIDANVVIINLTPHDLNIYRDGVLVETVSRTGVQARLAQKNKHIKQINQFRQGNVSFGKPIFEKVRGFEGDPLVNFIETQYFPPPKKGVSYVVSILFAFGFRETRQDILITGEGIRDEKGRIIGCEGLSVLRK